MAGSLQWITRQCRPELAFRCSKAQQAAAKGLVKDIAFVNKVVEYAKRTADRGLTFKSGIVDWSNLAMLTVTDASHATETVIGVTQEGSVKEEHYRSQGGRLHLLASETEAHKTQINAHLIGFAGGIIGRVCRSTLQAEAYQLSLGLSLIHI